MIELSFGLSSPWPFLLASPEYIPHPWEIRPSEKKDKGKRLAQERE
jgi:hypothetical protein